jgi:phosphoenolpyruvate carboxylase
MNQPVELSELVPRLRQRRFHLFVIGYVRQTMSGLELQVIDSL